MDNTLSHHGIKGQKWGVRRFQNADGTWTTAGKRRYGDESSNGQDQQARAQTKKKVAVGVAAGAATVAGVVLTVYLVKKMGPKKISEVADQAEVGKEAVKKIMETTSLGSTPVSQLPTMKALSSGTDAGKETVQKVLATAQTTVRTTSSPVSAPKVSVGKPTFDIPDTYNFETLMRQNSDLLKKMYADLAS